MALRIARGLFRLWLVSSVLWIAAVTAVTAVTLQGLADPEEFCAPKPALGEFSQCAFDAWKARNGQPIDGPWADYKSAEYKRTALVKESLKQGAELAFVPPVLVLVIGAMLAWAIKGFKR
jgi:hypothetical protein